MSKWKKGWKVLDGDRSFGWRELCHPVKYKKGVVVGRPKHCGPLSVFAEKRHAEKFVNFNSHCYGIIVPCDYWPSRHKELWDYTDTWDRPRTTTVLPEGTVLAEKVRCLE